MSNWHINVPPSLAGAGTYITTSSSGLGATQKVPEMPESCKEIPLKDLLDAADAIRHSRVNYSVNALESLTNEGKPLADWEVKKVEEAYNRFFVKYGSPLAKALK